MPARPPAASPIRKKKPASAAAPEKRAPTHEQTARLWAAAKWSATRTELHTLAHRRRNPMRTTRALVDSSRRARAERARAPASRDVAPVGEPRGVGERACSAWGEGSPGLSTLAARRKIRRAGLPPTDRCDHG